MNGSDQLQGPGAMADAGLLTFLKNTAPAGEYLRDRAKKYRDLAKAAEDQPVDPSVVDDLNTFASVHERAAELGDALWPDAQRGNEADFGRVETPRKGSTDVESKADVGRGDVDGVW
jgi:hypothetical protein